MSNDELIERLRSDDAMYGSLEKIHDQAADALEAADKRIAELEAERDEWQRGEGCATKAWGEAERKLAVAREALSAMLTHMGMDEDEWNKPTFDKAREVLAQIGGEDASS